VTQEAVQLILAAAIGYAVGSFSSGYVVGRLYRNVDLRRTGSGSTGATNTLRTLGPGAAALVVVLDILKGAAAAWSATLVVPSGDLRTVAMAVASAAAVAGHCWPVFLEGRGGRGVATAFGGFLFVASPAWVASIAAFALAIALTRMVSVGSLAAVAAGFVGYAACVAAGLIAFHWAPLAFMLAAGAMITLRHRANIERIARGIEPRLPT
jgi:acyl phosphate:glycerol-3-phosphate acyltransferase